MILPEPLRDHDLGRLERHLEGGREVHGHGGVPLLAAELQDGGHRADAGAVDEDVEGAEPVDAGGDDLGRRTRLGDVRLEELVAAAALLHQRPGGAVVVHDAGHEDAGPGGGQRHRERLAETRVAAGDDGVLPLEGEVVHREVADLRHGSLLWCCSVALGAGVFGRMFVKSSCPENIVPPGSSPAAFLLVSYRSRPRRAGGHAARGCEPWMVPSMAPSVAPSDEGANEGSHPQTTYLPAPAGPPALATPGPRDLIQARARRGTRARAGRCPRRPRAS